MSSFFIPFCPLCDVINFEINHSLLINLGFFHITNTSGQKCKCVENEIKAFSSLTLIKTHFLEGESPTLTFLIKTLKIYI